VVGIGKCGLVIEGVVCSGGLQMFGRIPMKQTRLLHGTVSLLPLRSAT